QPSLFELWLAGAERAGFEPAIPFRGIHTFQACSFNHSDTSPFKFLPTKGSGQLNCRLPDSSRISPISYPTGSGNRDANIGFLRHLSTHREAKFPIIVAIGRENAAGPAK